MRSMEENEGSVICTILLLLFVLFLNKGESNE